MSRYIDGDALKKRVSELIIPDWTRTLIRSWLDSEPTVDAVPVVRCKDCKHHEDEEMGMVYCPHIVGSWVAEDFYCADGERKDGERRTE